MLVIYMNKLGLVSIVFGVIGLILFLVSNLLVGYIDERIQNECDSEIGTIGQVTGLDEGECQNGRNLSDSVSSLKLPSLFFGTFLLIAGLILSRN